MRWAMVLAWSMAAASAAERDPAQVLLKASIKVRVRAASLPNYTCVQTVNRDFYKPKAAAPGLTCAAVLDERQHPTLDTALRLTLTDRLRLDVTLTSKGEIYSWVGASKFEDAGVDTVVRQGPIATGSFGALLAMVFAQDLETFQYRGTTQVEGRERMEYVFQVAREESHYKVRTPDSWVYTAYGGSFQVDPETSEVVRLAVQTAELPAATGSCQTTSNMEFAMVRIGDSEFPLPKQGGQRFVAVNGDEVENTTTFASCREYRGDSTISFSPAPETAGGRSQAAPPAGVPGGLPLTFELTTPISADTAAGGDPFTGRLVNALRSNGKTIAPANAVVKGRLLRVEMRRVNPLAANFVLKLRSVEIGGVEVPLAAERDVKRMSTPGAQKKGRLPILLPYQWEEDAAVIQVMGGHAVMKAGTRSEWLTR